MEAILNDKEKFLDTLLDYYTERGFGVVSKRDVDILMMHLLLKHSNFNKLSNHELSLKLKITEVKIKNLIHEAKLRFYKYNEEEIKNDFIKIIENMNLEIYQSKITLAIEDIYLRMEIQEKIILSNDTYDNALNESNLIISVDTFINLLEEFYDSKEVSKLLKKAKDIDNQISYKKIMKLFIEEVSKGGGKETGKIIAKTMFGSSLVSYVWDIVSPFYKNRNNSISHDVEDVAV